jgi:uncharacterized protein YcgI (DUF1989 family)
MKYTPMTQAPVDAEARKAIKPVICYSPDTLPPVDVAMIDRARASMEQIDRVVVPPREAECFHVPEGHFFRIISSEGPQVGDLNLWNYDNPEERFYSGKTRALHGTHISTGDRMWSTIPYLRPMVTVTHDTLDWYGWDEFGGSVHDVIGTRCDPYTNYLLHQDHYHHCCHSNLTRAFGKHFGDYAKGELLVHDVMNVFMCTGFTLDTHQYFMKASPVRPGDYIEFFAEMNILGGLSACPGGDCSSEHSSDEAACHPLVVEIYRPDPATLEGWKAPAINGYDRSHGIKP